ncbi:uncharacterized protein EMH_0044010 [Eimeria mitis]|uniref:tRNA-uridine aminocarboxypropyltransferase n=1 Tax=Eimeria mitis TaxID=44415 RepID=U6KAA5_9EIME|nr:uncharacterized protein EMH_0044010 [Eimeria mitis]CDJ32403.1 hypothetical protein, conserved [Eimeria mitis]
MPLVSVASQHATDSMDCSLPSAGCVTREAAEAEPETPVGELLGGCGSPAPLLCGSTQQQHHPQQQPQQKQQERLEQQHKREPPKHEQNEECQEDQQNHQQQQHQQGAKRRRLCSGCDRPCSVCYCSIIQGRDLSLSEQDVCSVVNRVLIFMHPLEKKRKNGSVRVLQKLVKGIEIWPHRRPGCCPFAAEEQRQQHAGEEEQDEVQRNIANQSVEGTPRDSGAAAGSDGLEKAGASGCRVDGAGERSQQQQHQPKQQRQPQLEQQHQQHLCTREGVAVCDTSRMVLLFPTESSLALGVGSLPVRLPVTLLAIDGTWKEAKEMFSAAPWLQELPAVHLPVQQKVDPQHHASVGSAVGHDPSAAGVGDAAASCGGSMSKIDNSEALRVSGAYGMIRTPPASVAASGGVCTAEAIAQALSALGRWGRSRSSSLLQIGETTRETLQHIVSLQQRMRDESSDQKLTA